MSVAATGLNKLIFGDKAFGAKPIVPDLPAIDPAATQLSAVVGNLGVLPSAQELAAKVNLFNQQQLDTLAEMATPGRAAVRKQEGDVIASMLRGELPKDVENLVLSRANARSQGGGYGGTGMAGAVGARDLGITSFDLTTKGIDAASKWLAQSQTAPLYNLGNMFLSSDQLLSFQFQERNAQHANKLTQAQVQAAPDPWSAAMAGEIDRLFNTFAQVGMASMGSMGGGGGAAPAAASTGSATSLGGGGGAYGGWGTSGTAAGKGV